MTRESPLYPTDAAIELRDVSRLYTVGDTVVKALDGITLGIDRHSFTAIMGPSGSGKSTLMALIGLLDKPSSGTILIDGKATEGMDEDETAEIRNRKIGFVFQHFSLLPKLSALDNAALPLLYAGVPLRERRERAEEMLERVGLRDRMKHRPSELSGGQKQRVAIARALINSPSIILADEPTGALDSTTGHEVMDLFHSLHAEGNTIVFVTHDRSLATECERIIPIRDGRISYEDA